MGSKGDNLVWGLGDNLIDPDCCFDVFGCFLRLDMSDGRNKEWRRYERKYLSLEFLDMGSACDIFFMSLQLLPVWNV